MADEGGANSTHWIGSHNYVTFRLSLRCNFRYVWCRNCLKMTTTTQTRLREVTRFSAAAPEKQKLGDFWAKHWRNKALLWSHFSKMQWQQLQTEAGARATLFIPWQKGEIRWHLIPTLSLQSAYFFACSICDSYIPFHSFFTDRDVNSFVACKVLECVLRTGLFTDWSMSPQKIENTITDTSVLIWCSALLQLLFLLRFQEKTSSPLDVALCGKLGKKGVFKNWNSVFFRQRRIICWKFWHFCSHLQSAWPFLPKLIGMPLE